MRLHNETWSVISAMPHSSAADLAASCLCAFCLSVLKKKNRWEEAMPADAAVHVHIHEHCHPTPEEPPDILPFVARTCGSCGGKFPLGASMCGNCGLHAERPRYDLQPYVPEFLAPPGFMSHCTREELRKQARMLGVAGPISRMTKTVLRDNIYSSQLTNRPAMARQLNHAQAPYARN